jgi:hypothetical protein
LKKARGSRDLKMKHGNSGFKGEFDDFKQKWVKKFRYGFIKRGAGSGELFQKKRREGGKQKLQQSN